MKACVLFLHGRYRRADLRYYRKLCRGRFTVAVDGGYSLFRLADLAPDLLIGDFDSLKHMPRGLTPATRVLRFPVDKDKTDAQLALEYCLDRGARQIDIVQPSVGEPDQFVGNLFLLTLARGGRKRESRQDIAIVNPGYRMALMDNEVKTIAGGVGDTVSVVPISLTVRYSCRGTRYPATEVRLKRGDTMALRNTITAKRAVFEVIGQAILVQQYVS